MTKNELMDKIENIITAERKKGTESFIIFKNRLAERKIKTGIGYNAKTGRMKSFTTLLKPQLEQFLAMVEELIEELQEPTAEEVVETQKNKVEEIIEMYKNLDSEAPEVVYNIKDFILTMESMINHPNFDKGFLEAVNLELEEQINKACKLKKEESKIDKQEMIKEVKELVNKGLVDRVVIDIDDNESDYGVYVELYKEYEMIKVYPALESEESLNKCKLLISNLEDNFKRICEKVRVYNWGL